MKVEKTDIEGVVILSPDVFEDERGYFFESYSKRVFDEAVAPVDFVQDNESCSSYGVIRGLHFQKGEAAQAKLVAAGLTEGNHTYALDSYAIAGGLAPTTVVYVKGTGDDAADIKAEAEKVVSALGLGSVQTFDEATAGESMDGFDIFVIVGKDALDTLK